MLFHELFDVVDNYNELLNMQEHPTHDEHASTPIDVNTAPPPSYVQEWIRIAIASALCFVCAGTVFGYNALKPIMMNEGIYSNYCHNSTIATNQTLSTNQTQSVSCIEQEEKLDRMFAVTVGVLGILAYAVGLLLDLLKRKATMIISGVVLALSSVAFAFSDSERFDAFTPSFIFLSTAGMAVYYSSLTYGSEVPRWGGFIIGLLSASWDVSALVPYFFHVLHFNAGLSLRIMFLCFAASGIPVIIFGFFMDAKKSEPQPKESILSFFKGKSAKEIIKEGLPYVFPYQHLLHIELWAMYIYTMVTIAYQNFYMQTLRSQLAWVNGYDTSETSTVVSLLYAFSIILPLLGPIVAIIAGKAKDFIGSSKLVMVQLPFIACMLITSVIKNSGLQYFTIVVFVAWRGILWVVITTFFFDTGFYPVHASGKLLAIVSVLAGIIGTFVCPPLESFVLNNLNGNYLWVNIIMISFSLMSCIVLVITTIRKEKLKKSDDNTHHELNEVDLSAISSTPNAKNVDWTEEEAI
jgi:MFS family permease